MAPMEFRRIVPSLLLVCVVGCVPFFDTEPSGTMVEASLDLGTDALDLGTDDLGTDDLGADATGDIGPLQGNLCGGPGVLRVDGQVESPGRDCGECGAGFWICNGPHELRCDGALPANQCGGCGELVATIGTSCGDCGDGRWICDGTSLECVGARNRNVCGGCDELSAEPGFACDAGTWQCDGRNAVHCVEGSRNSCGGLGPLLDEDDQPAFAGGPCGPCANGVLVCDRDGEGLVCEGAGELNACDGCASLQGTPEAPCGVCAGVWACDGTDRVSCTAPAPNRCGGCDELDDEALACPGGRRVCAGPDELSCVRGEELNLCGGLVELLGEPGESCGRCASGERACDGLDALVCAGDLGVAALNGCGGCGPMEAPLGTECEGCGTWGCRNDEPFCDRSGCD